MVPHASTEEIMAGVHASFGVEVVEWSGAPAARLWVWIICTFLLILSRPTCYLDKTNHDGYRFQGIERHARTKQSNAYVKGHPRHKPICKVGSPTPTPTPRAHDKIV
jgi:hypothetical protein